MLQLFLLSLLVGCSDDLKKSGPSSGASHAGSISVLTYNVHGLPALITGDDTPARMMDIAGRLGGFDLVGLQEDWMVDNHGLLLADVDYQTRSWFDETMMGRVYGSGLSTLARFSVLDARTVHYSTCHGTLDGASDCLASKGFQVHRLSVGDGSIDFYNTHFEAGGGAQDQEARAVQVEEVLDFIDSWSVGQAVVFTGDFNLHSQDAADAALLEGLQERAELVDACESVSCAEPTHIDRVWVRSGTDMLLTVTDWSNLSADFLDDQGVDLSDHPPLAAMVEWAVP